MNSNQDLISDQDLTPDQDLILDQDLTPNQITDLSTCICKAKEFLQKNSTEKAITVACIYNLPPSTLCSSISRPTTAGRGGYNKILQEHQRKALHQFICSLLACQIQPTYQLVFNTICNLKHAQEETSSKLQS